MDSKMKQNLCKSVNYNCELPVNFDCIIKKKTHAVQRPFYAQPCLRI